MSRLAAKGTRRERNTEGTAVYRVTVRRRRVTWHGRPVASPWRGRCQHVNDDHENETTGLGGPDSDRDGSN